MSIKPLLSCGVCVLGRCPCPPFVPSARLACCARQGQCRTLTSVRGALHYRPCCAVFVCTAASIYGALSFSLAVSPGGTLLCVQHLLSNRFGCCQDPSGRALCGSRRGLQVQVASCSATRCSASSLSGCFSGCSAGHARNLGTVPSA